MDQDIICIYYTERGERVSEEGELVQGMTVIKTPLSQEAGGRVGAGLAATLATMHGLWQAILTNRGMDVV